MMIFNPVLLLSSMKRHFTDYSKYMVVYCTIVKTTKANCIFIAGNQAGSNAEVIYIIVALV